MALAALAAGCVDARPRPPAILGVEPKTGVQRESTPVTIDGEFFVDTHVSYLSGSRSRLGTEFSAHLGDSALTDIQYLDFTHLAAVVPANLDVGIYDLVIEDPAGRTGSLRAAFTVSAAPMRLSYRWIAYNDCVYDPGLVGYGTDPSSQSVHYGDPSVITVFGVGTVAADHQAPPGLGYAASSGELKDHATGLGTGVTVTLTEGGGVIWQPQVGTVGSSSWSGGYDTAAGTDAYETFHGIVDMTGVLAYNYYESPVPQWWVEVGFAGLDPDKTYTFAASASRAKSTTDGGDGYTDRWTIFTVSGVDAAINASTPGTQEYLGDPLSVWFNTGNNHDEGYVARWVGIAPGADGAFTVRAEAHPNSNSGKAYGFSVFELAEEHE